MKPFITYAARSDMGCVRRNNEDNIYCAGSYLTEEMRNLPYKLMGKTDKASVFGVYDGMGGYQLGEKASLIASELMLEFDNRICNASELQSDEIIGEYINSINKRIMEESKKQSIKIGTTLALAVVLPDEIRAYNIGDSRIYVYDKNGLQQISVDHTLAMLKVKLGLITETQARESKEWNKLTACLGITDEDGNYYQSEILPPIKLTGKLRLLICSDGLTDLVLDDRIEKILHTSRTTELAVRKLMSEALNNGGKDNITAIVVDVSHKKYKGLTHRLKRNYTS